MKFNGGGLSPEVNAGTRRDPCGCREMSVDDVVLDARVQVATGPRVSARLWRLIDERLFHWRPHVNFSLHREERVKAREGHSQALPPV